MHTHTIKGIDEALQFHCSFEGNYSHGGKYLRLMDMLAAYYSGNSKAKKLSNMLDAYYAAVGVSNLDAAFDRLRKMKGQL